LIFDFKQRETSSKAGIDKIVVKALTEGDQWGGGSFTYCNTVKKQSLRKLKRSMVIYK